MFRDSFFILALIFVTGCDSQPRTPEDVRRAELPKVINRRPDFPADKAVLHVQAQTLFLRQDADISEAWSLVGSEGLDAHQVKLWHSNALRIGTMDAVTVGQFYEKLPRRTGGAKLQTIGVGHEPVVFETAPTLERALEIEALLGVDRDETVRLPTGRMQLLIDVVVSAEKVTAGLTPHHHWVSPTLTPRTPEEKAMDGRVFKELSVEADVTGDRYLVISWLAPEKKKEEKVVPVEQTPVEPVVPIEPPPMPPMPTENKVDGVDSVPTPVPPAAPVPPVQISPFADPVRVPRIGDVLLTGLRAERPLQMICIIRIPPQGESIPASRLRPE